MNNDDYHGSEGVSNTTLGMIAEDLFKPAWSKECPVDEEKLKTFDFGDGAHAMFLEPNRLNEEFVFMPDFNMRTNNGKEGAQQFKDAHKDFKILSAGDYKKLRLMFESVMAHPRAREIIEAEGVAESSYFWTDEETGIKCRVRPDKKIGLKLTDVKTTPDLKKFHFAVEDFGYHRQDAFYCDGVGMFEDGPVSMEFLVIQKTIEIGKYPVMLWKLPEDAVKAGRIIYRQSLRDYADFLSSDKVIATPELKMSWRFMERAEEAIANDLS
jgi:exodeoxyribonuclease VIII